MKKQVLFLGTVITFLYVSGEALAKTKTFTCGDGCTATLDDDGIFTIFGTGQMDGYLDLNGNFMRAIPWGNYMEDIKTVKLAEDSTINNIGSAAFYRAHNLTTAIIPNITDLGRSAFNETGLVSINMPNVTKIGVRAFYNTYELSYAYFQNGTTVGEMAFASTKIPTCGNNEGNCGTCNDYIKSGTGCVSECGSGYRTDFDAKRCIEGCANGQVEYKGECLDEYPFSRKHWTPSEAAQWLNEDNNEVILTFKK